MVHYSVIASGPDISRKSKHAFRLSTPEPIPHQHQHHLFFTESALSLQKWTHAVQAHIDYAMFATSKELALQSLRDEHGQIEEQSVIDKVLERLQLEDPMTSQPIVAEATKGTTQGCLPHLPSNFPLSHEDNNDTWSSASSIPVNNAGTDTTTSLDYIVSSLQQQQQQMTKSSMDSMRDSHSAHHPSGSGSEFNQTGSDVNNAGYLPGTSFMEQQSSMSDASRSSMQSDYQGRTSLQQSRVAASKNDSYPFRSSAHSGASVNHGTWLQSSHEKRWLRV